MELKNVSKAMLMRLPAYLSYLKTLPEDDSAFISSKALATALGLGDVLVRKDLAKVSDGGRCKTGHHRQTLIRDIETFLDYHTATDAVLVGAGKLGQALLSYSGFDAYGLNVIAGFDVRPGRKPTGTEKPIYAMRQLESFCRSRSIRFGIITVPAAHAQEVCNKLVACGIQAIWNFAPVHLTVPESVMVQNENLAVSLTALRMRYKQQNRED